MSVSTRREERERGESSEIVCGHDQCVGVKRVCT